LLVVRAAVEAEAAFVAVLGAAFCEGFSSARWRHPWRKGLGNGGVQVLVHFVAPSVRVAMV